MNIESNKQSLLIKGGTIIDGRGGRPVQADILVDGRVIAAVGRDLDVPEHCTILDGKGRFIIPGLMDANVHLIWDIWPKTLITFEGRYDEMALEVAQIALKSGVTTVFDTWGPREYLARLRDRLDSGNAIGARLFIAGNIVGFDGPFSVDFLPQYRQAVTPAFADRINAIWEENVGRRLMWMTPEQVRAELREYVTKSVDFIKVAVTGHLVDQMEFLAFSPRVLKIMVEEARRAGLTVQTHTTSVEGLHLAAELGFDLLQHPDSTGPTLIPDETVELIAQKRIACAIHARTEKAYAIVRARSENDPYYATFDIAAQNARRLIEGGANIVLATDGGTAGTDTRSGQHFQMIPAEENVLEMGEGHFHWLLAAEQMGMKPMDILQAATINIARAYKVDDRLGTLEKGKIADLLILKANPLEAVANYREIEAVVKDGRVIDRDALPTHPELTA